MLRLVVLLSVVSLLTARPDPQVDTDYQANYDSYDLYGDYYEYEDYETGSQDLMIDRSQAGERFPRQTFSTGTTNSVRGQRQQTAKTTARPTRQSQRQSARQTAANPPLGPYRYGYAVTDENGLDFNQQETSDGGVVNGQYSVVLPDGRIQTVKYSVAPDTGYVAEVSYSGGSGGVVFEGQAGK